MSSPSATGFPDTVVLPEGLVSTGKPHSPNGKIVAGTGKPLPARLPEGSRDDALEAAKAVAEELRVLSMNHGRKLRFEVDLEGGRTIIYVLDRATGELIRRIPREELPRLLTASGRFDLRLLDVRL